jgi:putative MATE family efflux protein
VEAQSISDGRSALLDVTPEKRADFLWAIWALAWPVILTMSLESVVFLLDMLMVGQLGASAVAAVGIGTQIMFAANTVMIAVATGTLAIVARHVGAGEIRQAEEVALQSVLLAVALALVVVVPLWTSAPAAMRAFGVEDAVIEEGALYLRIVLLGLPLDAVFAVCAFALRGAGDTRTPLWVGGGVGIIKVMVSYVLIFGASGLPALGVAGAAWGTVTAFGTGAVAVAALLGRGGLVVRFHRADLGIRGGVLRRLFTIGYPAAIEHALMQFGFFVYFYFAAKYSTAAVAAYVIGVRILGLSFLPGFGFAAAASTVVGQNLGAKRPATAMRAGWETVRLALYAMTCAGVSIFVAARPIAELFVDDPDVVDKAVTFIRVLAAAQPLMAIDFVLGGALRGSGDTRFPLFAVLIGFYLCRLGSAWIATFWLELPLVWLWLALLPDYVARCILKALRFRSGRWQTIKV